MPAPEIPLQLRSLELWRGLSARLGMDCGYRQCGTLYLITNQEEQHKKESWLSGKRHLGIDAKILSKGGCLKLAPSISADYLAGMFTPRDGKADPSIVTAQIATAAAKRGAVVLSCCSTLQIETSGGAVSGVVTEKGSVRARNVVIAAGIWSSRLLLPLDIRLPQLGILASVAEVEGLSELDINLSASNFGITRRMFFDGSYRTHRAFGLETFFNHSCRGLPNSGLGC